MKSRDYFPKSEDRFLVWFDNFVDKIKIHTASIGVTPVEITQFENDLTEATKQITDVENSKTNTQALVKMKNSFMEQVEKRIRDKVAIMKRLPGYNLSIGEDLGVLPADNVAGKGATFDGVKPSFTYTILPDRVRLDWTKSEFDGVVIQCRRGSDTNFSTLGTDTVSPYEDIRPSLIADNPETRVYRMRYLVKDNEVGQWSDEARLICHI